MRTEFETHCMAVRMVAETASPIQTVVTRWMRRKDYAKQRLRPGVGGPGSQEERVLCLA